MREATQTTQSTRERKQIDKPRSANLILTESQMIGSDHVKLLKEFMPTLGKTPITPQFARATLTGLRQRYGMRP